ncbi:MAG: HXXEE domain-containing protein [Gemmataceae bacterium]|nr:HXXEE domain-containing protein [Gemmataceae bacterium]
MQPRAFLFDWLVTKWQWPQAALFSGIFLLGLFPLWISLAPLAVALIYLQLPLYMIHQWEEHAGDRFRKFFNGMFGGKEALTPVATFWVNSLGVWAVDLTALYLAVFIDLSFGLVAIYLPLLNSLGHILPALFKREYNPGLITSVVLFVPLGAGALYWIQIGNSLSWKAHALGVALAFAIHAAIIVYVRIRLFRMGNGLQG